MVGTQPAAALIRGMASAPTYADSAKVLAVDHRELLGDVRWVKVQRVERRQFGVLLTRSTYVRARGWSHAGRQPQGGALRVTHGTRTYADLREREGAAGCDVAVVDEALARDLHACACRPTSAQLLATIDRRL